MPIEIRNYLEGFSGRAEALQAVIEMDEAVFGEPIEDDDVTSPVFGVIEDDRTFCAWDGDEMVGTCANFSLTTSTPGASMPTAGVTFIGVRPTHRRRGVMRQMLETLHADGVARDEPIATLWVADPAIYGRFGYGLATQRLSIEVPHAHAALVDAPEDPSLRVRMVDIKSDYDLVAPIYEAVASQRGGVLSVDEKWNARQVHDAPAHRDGATRAQTVVVEDANGVRGFVRYALKAAWPTGRYAEGSVIIYRLMSVDAAAHAALWRYCLSIDLMTKTTWWNLPVDDPVLTWLENSRQTKQQINDAMWVRILDLPKALTGRTYASDVDVILQVSDPDFAANDGSWRLRGGPDGAECTRTNDAADVSLDIRTVGAVFLGGPTLNQHAHAGRVEEHTSGAVAASSSAFGAPWAAYCPYVF